MLVVLALVLRFFQGCVFASLVVGWLGADPDHPAVRQLRAIAEPFLALARPLARKLPGPLDWTSTVIVLFGLDVVRRVIGG